MLTKLKLRVAKMGSLYTYLDMHRLQLVGVTEFSVCLGEEFGEGLATEQEGIPIVFRHRQTPSLGHSVGAQPLEDVRDVREDPCF